jgi:hypothetical protein
MRFKPVQIDRIGALRELSETREMRLHSTDFVGQDGILRAGWQPAPGGRMQTAQGGLPTRRRLPTCPTSRHPSSLNFASLYSASQEEAYV